MKQPVFVIAALAAALAGGNAIANMELAQKSGCTSCHALDKKVVGPSYKDVAAKYKGNKDAEALLAEKVKKGGSGTWGPVPMPPNAAVKDDDVKALVKWILAM
jgi:cytochrome c